MTNNSIGILDSGLGGLTIWREIVTELPHESTVYIGDSQNTPYGDKSPEEIFRLAKRSVDFLLTKHATLIVTACNSITVSCVDQLRATYPHIPIVGTVPAIKLAAEQTKKKRIGVLATTRTVESEYQTKLITEFASDCQVVTHGTDRLVPLIEQGILGGEQLDSVLKQELAVFQQFDVDVLVLGCTHFPFLKSQIQQILGNGVIIIDSGEAIARQVRRVLENNHALTDQSHPEYDFYTTGDKTIANKLLHAKIGDEKMTFVSVKV